MLLHANGLEIETAEEKGAGYKYKKGEAHQDGRVSELAISLIPNTLRAQRAAALSLFGSSD
jgi:hypothetical protein